jgi:hypothetical protein
MNCDAQLARLLAQAHQSPLVSLSYMRSASARSSLTYGFFNSHAARSRFCLTCRKQTACHFSNGHKKGPSGIDSAFSGISARSEAGAAHFGSED